MIGRRSNLAAILLIVIAGAATFATGLGNPFNGGDDYGQIVNNPPVHSIDNIALFFRGGTFYNGGAADAPLIGSYYRPLMTTVFSLIYTLFGPTPVAYHIVQQALCIGGAVLLYLVFVRCSFHPVLALLLSLTFLLHPLDSQAVYAIPYMQDALFFFFGILAFWLLLRFHSRRALIPVVFCLWLSLFSKETGILFLAILLIYLIWWNRARLWPFVAIAVIPVALWAVLRVAAVGVFDARNDFPIDRLDLGGRLLTAPSVILLFAEKLVWPLHLATSYYFVHPTPTLGGVIIPLVADLVILAAVVAVGIAVGKRGSQALRRTYWFFFAWTVLGLLTCIGIVPLDATATEAWFRLPMAGVLGMAGIAITTFTPRLRVRMRFPAAAAAAVVVLLAVGTAARGMVWGNSMELAQQDLVADPGGYHAYLAVADQYLARHQFERGKPYAEKAVAMFPNGLDYDTLGQLDAYSGDYRNAAIAYDNALKYVKAYFVVEHLAALTSVYGNPVADQQFLLSAVRFFPHDATLWFFLADLDYTHGDVADAQQAIAVAYRAEPGNQTVADAYTAMMSRQPYTLTFSAP